MCNCRNRTFSCFLLPLLHCSFFKHHVETHLYARPPLQPSPYPAVSPFSQKVLLTFREPCLTLHNQRCACLTGHPSEVGQLDYYITLFASCQVLFLLFLKKFFCTLFSASLSRSDLLSISPFSPFVNTFFKKILSVFWIFFLGLIMRTAQKPLPDPNIVCSYPIFVYKKCREPPAFLLV